MSIAEWFSIVFIPLLTGLGGWLGGVYRNKEKKQADILANMEHILDRQDKFIAESAKRSDEQDKKIDEQGMRIRNLEKKVNIKDIVIRQAYGCSIANKECPVLSKQHEIDSKQEKRGNL